MKWRGAIVIVEDPAGHVLLLSTDRMDHDILHQKPISMPRMKPPPDDAPFYTLAAHAVHHAAADALGVSTQRAVAEAAQTSPQEYSDCLRGRNGSLNRVHSWLVALKARGVYLELRVRADGVECVNARP